MNDLNITFEPQPATANGPSLAVRCDRLPTKHDCRIDEQPRVGAPSVWYVYTTTRHAYSRRRGLTRKHWEFKSLDAAKAAAVAYVRARVAEAQRQEPARHGAGQYRKGERGWYVLFDSCPTRSWQPAGTKKEALALLDNALVAKASVVDGVCRWKSNGSVPPADCLDSLAAAGLVFDRQKTDEASAEDLRRLVESARQSPRDDSPEAHFERLAAFGPGQEIVDVLSGHRYRT